MVHIATDGESYGHHHRYGEMALSYALQFVEEHNLATLTNYGEFLEKFPPAWEATICENTSWSCAHGVERWRSDCGCNGGRAGWNQRWDGPLREALDTVRDGAAPLAASLGSRLFRDWPGACDRYVSVLLDRPSADEFLLAERGHALSPSEQVQALKLLELCRHAQLMYTSCGWFFDDISGIETVQIIAYAARVLELAANLFGTPGAALEPVFLASLAQAQSNVAAEGSGADIYHTRVCPLKVGLDQVAAHFAVSSVFQTYPEHTRVFAFDIENQGQEIVNSGRGRLVCGKASLRSILTHEHQEVAYAVLHFGDQNIAAGVKRTHKGHQQAYLQFIEDTRAAMLSADFPSVIRLFDQEFDGKTYTIRSLFTDEQRRVLNLILNQTVAEAEQSLIRLYEDHASLLHFLSHADVPRPSALALAANFAINVTLRRAIESDPFDGAQVRAALARAAQDQVQLDQQELSFVADQRMRSVMLKLAAEPENRAALESAFAVAQGLRLLPFPADTWQAQNLWHQIAMEGQVVTDQPTFLALGRALGIMVEAILTEAAEPTRV